MQRHKSAIKRHRQSLKRHARNQSLKARLRTLVKKARTALDGESGEAPDADVQVASRALAKAVGKGILHKNAAARKISRLQRALAKKRQAAPAAAPAKA